MNDIELGNNKYIKRTVDGALETTRHAIAGYGAVEREVDYAAIRQRAKQRGRARSEVRSRARLWGRITHGVHIQHPVRAFALAALLLVVVGFGLLYLNGGRGYTLQRAVDSSVADIFDAPAFTNLDAAAVQYMTASR